MIKEFFLTIILGAVLGFGATGAFFAFCKNNTNQNTSQNSPTPTIGISNETSVTPTISETNSSLKISSPEEGTIVSTSKTNIKGTAKPNSLIIISTPSKTFNDRSNANGIFSISVELDSGINLIKISSIDSEDNQENIELNLTYSTTKI